METTVCSCAAGGSPALQPPHVRWQRCISWWRSNDGSAPGYRKPRHSHPGRHVPSFEGYCNCSGLLPVLCRSYAGPMPGSKARTLTVMPLSASRLPNLRSSSRPMPMELSPPCDSGKTSFEASSAELVMREPFSRAVIDWHEVR